MSDLEKLFNKVDKIDERLNNIDVTLVRQCVSLEEHVWRTNLIEAELRPIKRHVNLVETSFKLIGALAVLLAIIDVAVKLFL